MSRPVVEKPSADMQGELSFWGVVSLSLRGKQHDYTSLSLDRAVLLLAVPMVLEMLMESLFVVVNIFWVSRLGTEAVAVVGLTESFMTLIYVAAFGLAIAATAIVARRTGEKNPERAAQAAGQVLVLGAITSVGVGLLLGSFAPEILRLMGAEESVVTLGADFARIMLGFNTTAFMIFLINAIFRGVGDVVLAMRTLWLANAVNMLLAPCLIFGVGPFPELGIVGAAIATNIGRGTGVAYQLWHLLRHNSRVQLQMRHLRLVPSDVRAISITASTGMTQLLIGTTSWIALMKILSLFGSAALAGFTVAMRIVAVVLLPAAGIAGAGATLVGQNLGAGQFARAEEAIGITTRFNMIFLVVLGLLVVATAGQIVGLFTTDPDVLHFGTSALWIVGSALPLYGIAFSLGAAFNGAGDTWTPTRLNFYCLWLGQIPLAWILAHSLRLGPKGVFIALPISLSVLALWNFVMFKRGRWKHCVI